IRLWNCANWETIGVIPEKNCAPRDWIPALTFQPTLPVLASAGVEPAGRKSRRSRFIHIWEFDLDVLLSQRAGPVISYTSAKVVLVGDSGVGKTGLGWRLA